MFQVSPLNSHSLKYEYNFVIQKKQEIFLRFNLWIQTLFRTKLRR